MNCNLTLIGSDYWVCDYCWIPVFSSRSVKRNCLCSPEVEEAKRKLGVLGLSRNYFAALSRWTSAGFPTRDDDQVGIIYRNFCQKCEHLNGGSCDVCGCRVNEGELAVTNKIKMATERCPLNPPKWS